jgi:hypothetical protein
MSIIEPIAPPDYESIINAMPEVMSFRGTAAERRAKAAAARAAALRSLAVRYGGLGNVQDKYGDIDDPTRAAAQANQFSDLARLGRSYDEAVLGTKRGLASRRMLQSGELDHGLNQAQIARGTAEYDLGQNFSQAAARILQGYVDVEDQLGVEEANTINQAATSAGLGYSVPVPTPTPSTTTVNPNAGSYSNLGGDRVPMPDVVSGQAAPVGRDVPLYYSVIDGALKGLGFE